jgi:hypothetical protein
MEKKRMCGGGKSRSECVEEEGGRWIRRVGVGGR